MRTKHEHARPYKFIVALAVVALACALAAAWVIDAPPSSAHARARAAATRQETKNDAGVTVYGRVVYEGTSRPVRRARIVLLNADGTGRERSGLTDARGEFRIREVPAGSYFPGVDAPGVVSPVSFVALEELRGDAMNVDEIRKHADEIVIDGTRDEEVTVRARRGAAISGRVTYADGDPAVGVLVHVLRKSEGRMAKFLIGLSPSALAGMGTDDRGVFRVAGLPPGEYVVGVSEAAEHGVEGQDDRPSYIVGAPMRGMSKHHLLVNFHPSATSASKAAVLKVGAGEEREDADITIADRETRTLAGIVRARGDRRPVARAKVTIIRRDGDAGLGAGVDFSPLEEYSRNYVLADEEGRWLLRDVPDGSYTIFVDPPDEYERATTPPSISMNGNLNPDAGGTITNANITITNSNVSVSNMSSYVPPRRVKKYAPFRMAVDVSGDVAELAIELGEGGRVSGTTAVEGGKPLAGYGYVYAIKVMPTMGEQAGDETAGASAYGGTFTFDGLTPGKYFIHAVNMDGGERQGVYVKSITWRGKDLLREPLEIGEGTSVEGVRIVYASDAATLRVRVPRPEGARPARNVHVLLMPADAPRWSPYTQQFHCTTRGKSVCEISAPPGDYLIISLGHVEAGRGALEEEIRRRAAVAPRVSVRGGETKTVDAPAP